MKIWAFAVLTMLFIAGGAASDAIVVKSISRSLRPTPVPRYDNETSRSKTSGKNRWLQLSVTFIPTTSAKPKDGWYDDVTMEGLLVMSPPGKEKKFIVLSGKTRYFTIPADDKDHYGVFYVPPAVLARYCGDSAGAMKAIESIRISFYGPGRILLGNGYWVASGKSGELILPGNKKYATVAARMKEYEKPYRDVVFLRGGLYSKEKTPWVYFDYDFYDLIYDNVQPQTGESIKK